MVLLILGILLGGLLSAISQVSENTRRIQARGQLERIEEALYGFAQANGRLPCPATTTSARDGYEDPVGGGNCNAQHGFVPNGSLGISGRINTDGLLLDPWGNPYRYSVATQDLGPGRSFTSVAGLQQVFGVGAVPIANMLSVCEAFDPTLACGGGNMVSTPSDSVPAILFSMGANWATFSSLSEQANSGNGTTDGAYRIGTTNVFVDSVYVEDQYEDILLWISPYVLYGKLIEVGRLP